MRICSTSPKSRQSVCSKNITKDGRLLVILEVTINFVNLTKTPYAYFFIAHFDSALHLKSSLLTLLITSNAWFKKSTAFRYCFC